MKKIIILVVLTAATLQGFSQSRSYQALQKHFKGEKDVYAFSVGGMLCRIAVKMMKSENEVIGAMMKDIHHVRFMVIPHDAFEKQNLTVAGFKRVLKTDEFVELATIRDKGEIVTIFHRSDENAKDRYFVLVEEQREVVAIEMKGTIDPSLLNDEDKRISINK